MPASLRQPCHAAFAAREILIIVAVVALLALIMFARSHNRAVEVRMSACVHHLNHIGRSFNLWANERDHDGLYPMSYFIDALGRMPFADATDSFHYFQVMSNELQNASILACPADTQNSYATNFTSLDRRHLGYFIGLDADPSKPRSILAGDRNFSNGATPQNGRIDVTAIQPLSWSNDIHGRWGNLLLADGSVAQLSSSQLKQTIAATTLATNRLVLP